MKKYIVLTTILLVTAIGVLGALVYQNQDILFKSEENGTNQTVIVVAEKKEPTKEEKYLALGKEQLEKLTLDEKIGQLFLVRYPNDSNAAQIASDNCLGGYVLFEKDFKNKTTEQVQEMINKVQNNCKIPLITAVDEEGGTVIRISSNKNLASEKFKSPRELYTSGGLEAIKQDTKAKAELLSNLGINLNLAPVIDVSTNANDYMYKRTLGEGVELTSEYAKTVIEASKECEGVSFTLKHFPGYGNNKDTHKQQSIDKRTYEEIQNTAIPPFKAGIEAGAESILISHNIIECIDEENPASISPKVHEMLRNDLEFKGVIITDDLAMSAVSNIENVYVKALLAGNNLIITSDYATSINAIKQGLADWTINEAMIDEAVTRTLAWKCYKGLI